MQVRAALRALWAKTVEMGSALDLPGDGSEAGDAMAARHSRELGVRLGEFRVAVATELGIDDAFDVNPG
ncbi:MAG TPA: hypothetical protein VLA91_07590 [Acidimicrobiia bacterium]|nr:hypothetical protein [Acidimicrobiia bacterium]